MEELTAAILAIGNELLSGKVQDTNTPYLIGQLRELGVHLKEVHVLPDEEDVIARVARPCIDRYSLVFTTGGVGPTHDDVTFSALAEALEVSIERHPELVTAIHSFYGEAVNEEILSMADLPQGAELVYSERLVVPAVKLRNVWVFPGEPIFLRRKFEAIRERFRTRPFFLERLYSTLDEGELAPHLAELEARHRVQIGSYPRYDGTGGYRVLLTVEGKDAQAVTAAANTLWERIPCAARVRRTTGSD